MAKKRKSGKSVTHQVRDINKRYRETVGQISDNQEKVVTAILILAQTRASYYTPQDTNALINSQYRRIIQNDDGKIVGRVGYTQNYALALHGDENKTPLWNPRPPNTPGKKGGGYNPNASPRFLERGFNDEESNIKRVIVEQNKL